MMRHLPRTSPAGRRLSAGGTRVLAAAALGAGLLWAADAAALMITVNGVQDSGSTTLIASGPSPLDIISATCCAAANPFALSILTAEGTPTLPSGTLRSSILTVTAPATASTLSLWITQQGVTSPTGSVMFNSGLQANGFSGAVTSVSVATFLSPTNTIAPPAGTQLDTVTFTGSGSQTLGVTEATGAGPYALQQMFQITATGVGSVSLVANLSAAAGPPATPEPGSLALLGTALAGFGIVGLSRRRDRQRFRSAAAPGPFTGIAGRGFS